VNDEQDGKVRSKLQRAVCVLDERVNMLTNLQRELELVREQRQRENEAKVESKKARLVRCRFQR
jgi:hypothetical protein